MPLFKIRTLMAGALLAALSVTGGCATYERTIVISEESHAEEITHGQIVAAEKHFNTGMKFYKKGKYKQAVKHFEKAVRKNPHHWRAHYFLGVAHRELRDYRVARHRLNLALKTAPSDNKEFKARVYAALGVTWESIGDPVRAETNYALAIRLDSHNRVAREGLKRMKGPKGKSKIKRDRGDDDDEWGDWDDDDDPDNG